jgi:hypothetical protein
VVVCWVRLQPLAGLQVLLQAQVIPLAVLVQGLVPVICQVKLLELLQRVMVRCQHLPRL